jgi:hypothetical protein
MYAFTSGTALPSFVRENAGDAQNMVRSREYPSVDRSREALHDQTAGARESREFIHFEHDWPL